MNSHLDVLEKESIELIREVLSTNTLDEICCFYSIGKDSSVLLKLFEKACWPNEIPIKFLHIDTDYKFKEMYEFKEKIKKKINLITYINPEKLNPFEYDSSYYTNIMKTQALIQALKLYKIKIAFGGARREEEKSRAKERMVSIRYNECWNPRIQNSEINYLWNTFHTENTTLRIFPLSNWTELDIWEYIKQEKIEVVPIYFAHERKVILKNGQLFATQSEKGDIKQVRFRTLGCYPLSAAIESRAKTPEDIIEELKNTKYSERAGRMIDYDQDCSMEKKKKEGYF